MATYLVRKEVSALPTPLAANTVYYVRTGIGFDIYVSDSTGSVVHKSNSRVPAGGTTGQSLTKASATDYDLTWATPAGGGGGAPNIAQVSNTNTSTNINTTSFTEIPIAGTTDILDSTYFTVVGNGIRCLVAGRVKCTAIIRTTSSPDLLSLIKTALAKNSVRFGAEGVGGGAITDGRGTNYYDGSAQVVSYATVAANDIITLLGARVGGAGSLKLAQTGTSILLLEQWG